MLDGDTVRTGLLEKEKLISAKLTNSTLPLSQVEALNQELAKVYQDLEDIDADKQESNASAILHGLGFSTQQQQAATRTFSGGWRMRLALARCLFCKPDVLLADEVTNYLDFPAVVWLETHLLEFKGTLLVVSHDRSFLDTVSTDILHMHHGQLEAYRGSFSYFVSTRKERQRADLREYESQLAYRQHLQAFIDRWRYNAKRSSQAQSKIKILEKLGPLIPPRQDEMEGMGQDSSVYFRFPAPEKLSPPILQIDGVEFGYGPKGRSIFNQVSLDVQMDSKIALVGPNGAGKSTLVYLLTGQQQPRRGFVHQHGRLRIGLFSQHHVDQVDLSQSSIEFLQHAYPGMHEEEYRRILGRFGLSSTVATQAIGSLSGGQKSRVVFANMAMGNPHILILDEPTNHLDMDTIDALREALLEFQGGIVIVSHDSSFLDGVCTDVCVVDGGLSWFTGDPSSVVGLVTQYKQMLVAT